MFLSSKMLSLLTSSLILYIISNAHAAMLGTLGETSMHHIVRSSQHLGISEFTGRPTTAGVQTAITKHIKSNSCNSSLNNFKILGREVDYHRRHIKESLFIKYYDYDLNKQQTSTQLFLF